MIVIDASVLTDFLVGRPGALDAVGEAIPEQEPLHAPELIDLEVLSALRRLNRRGLSDDRASRAASDLGRVRLIRYPHAPLCERIWELRADLTSYDASYLALAEGLYGSLLLTGDGGLASRARKSLGARRVRRVS